MRVPPECDLGFPLAYFITFTCYGTHLHGSLAGSVDRTHRLPGSELIPPDACMQARDEKQMRGPKYHLDAARRKIAMRGILEALRKRHRAPIAVHIRSTHVHAAVSANERPEPLMNAMKAGASRFLNRASLDDPGVERWTRHGSTRYLWSRGDVEAALEYIVFEQGQVMELFISPDWEGTVREIARRRGATAMGGE